MSVTISALPATGDARVANLLNALRLGKDHGYFLRCLKDADRTVLVATLDSNDVGLCVFNRAPTYTPFHRLNIPELQDLNVHPDCRRRGIGATLVKAVEDRARAEGFKTLGIGVGLSLSYGAAQRLYMKLGYMPDGAGVAYDGTGVTNGELRPIDDLLCLMMMKDL